MGKRKTERKIPSPLTGLSSSQAHRNPMTSVPTRNAAVNRTRFFRECWKLGSEKSVLKFSSPTKPDGLRPEIWAARWVSIIEVRTLTPIIP